MKKKFILIFVLALVLLMGKVSADDIEDNTGSGSGTTANKVGNWKDVSGFRVVILDSNGNLVVGTKRINIINGSVGNGVIDYNNDGKIDYKNIKITTNSYSKIEYIKKGVVNTRNKFDKSISKANVYTWSEVGVEEFGNYLGNKKGIKVSGVKNYFQKKDYKNLKTMLNVAGYTCFSNKPNQEQCKNSNDHYVVVEPITVIGDNLGTAYEFAADSWKKPNGNCESGNCWNSPAFHNMHQALFVDINTNYFGGTIISNLEENKNCDSSHHYECYKNINKNLAVAMGIYKINSIGEVTPTKGTLIFNKTDLNGTNIKGKKAIIKLYTDANCSGTVAATINTGTSGKKIINISAGTYYLKETAAPNGYILPSQTVCTPFEVKQADGAWKSATNVTISNGSTVEVRIKNQKIASSSCETEFNYLPDKKDKQARLELYNEYGIKNLLNFNLIEADQVCNEELSCDYSDSTSCLSGNYASIQFNENNWSCYNKTEIIGGKTAYCLVKFEFQNLLGKTSFTSQSGRMFVSAGTISSANVGKGILSQECYVAEGTNNINSQVLNIYSSYIGDIKFNSKKLSAQEINNYMVLYKNGNKYSGKIEANYKMPEVFAFNGTGELTDSNCNNCKFLGYGFVSMFADNFTNIPFSIEIKDGNISEEGIKEVQCPYVSTPELIKQDEMQIVFRVVNTNIGTAFLDKNGNVRNPSFNWSGYADIISNNNDSYNKTKEGAKYKITLTPSLIAQIREYNSDNPYDDYNLKCKNHIDGRQSCISNYLTELKDNHNLEINNSEKRTCVEGNKVECD